MAYYLGRDVTVYLTTESTEAQVDVVSNKVSTGEAGGGSGAAATATITFTGIPDIDEEITIISTDGTSVDYIAKESASAGTNQFTRGGGESASAANLRTAILGFSHSGKITGAVNGTGGLTLTQSVVGTSGNKTITEGLSNCTATSFTGGTDDPDTVAATFAENLDLLPVLTKIKDLTGVDLSIGVTDEDITFMNNKTVLKAEIKKETTVSLTRKKSDNVWDVVYNGPTTTGRGWTGSASENGDYGARWGVIEGAADTWYINNGLIAPKSVTEFGGSNVTFGYRVFIELKSGEEIISIPGCQLIGHTITLNADGITEETCELISQVTPQIGSALTDVDTRLTAGDM